MCSWKRFALIIAAVSIPAICGAHPMGNFSINHYSRLELEQRSVELLYLVDRAEIPTYQEIQQSGIVAVDRDRSVGPYLVDQARLLKQGLRLECDGHAVDLLLSSRKAEFVPGAGGLPTLKIRLTFRGKLDGEAALHTLSYADNNFPGRAGWKEMIVVADSGTTIRESSAPDRDRSGELSVYSTDLLNSPPQQLTASVAFILPAVTPLSRGKSPEVKVTVGTSSPSKATLKIQDPKTQVQPPIPTAALQSVTRASNAKTPRSRFTELIATQKSLSFWFLISAAFIAAGLGALHALEPGHGKTIVGAYLVGSRGTASHAVLLGIVVTIAHTASVFALGAITLYASSYIVPEQLYPWLGALSGLSIITLGILIFLRHLTGSDGDHSHAAGSRHTYSFLSLFKKELSARDIPFSQAAAVSLRQLIVLGVTGGIVPCPAALVVLLSAFSLHRVGFGLFLIVAFSVGLAAVLVAIGLVMVYSKRLVSSYFRTGSSFSRYLPLFSSAFMVVVGVGIGYSALVSIPASQTFLSRQTLMPFLTVILLGLFLGMRHSTDSDHVVAVSTLVSRQGSIRGSALIGLLWGLGHTITIFLVGTAIIIFGVVIPPRLGLSMEFCVALMLIILGALNLTGTLGRITQRFSPPAEVSGIDLRSGKAALGLGRYHTIRPLFVGLVHGLAGSAAVALLVLSTIRSPFLATGYLLVFGLGTMMGMMLMTAAISIPLVFAKSKFRKLTSHLTFISGLASVAFGVFLVIQIGFVDGLFTAQLHWTPH